MPAPIESCTWPERRFTRAPVRFVSMLVAYFLFGFGYIGYMTFVVTLLRESCGLPAASITAFYVALGVAVFVSSWVWARAAAALSGRRGDEPC